MRSICLLTLLLITTVLRANTRFDSLFAKSHVVVVGRIARQNSERPITAKQGNRHFLNFKIEQVALAGIPLPDSSGILLTGDTLKMLSYITGIYGDSINPHGPSVLLLIRDTSTSCGWRLTDEIITRGAFTDVYVFFSRFTTYYEYAGSGQSARIEVRQGKYGTETTRYYPDGKVYEVREHTKRWYVDTYYFPDGSIQYRSRTTRKRSRKYNKSVQWTTWQKGHRSLRRRVIRIVD